MSVHCIHSQPMQMTYRDAIDWLYSTQQFGIKLGLEQACRLLRDTDSYPKPGTKVIHVAGTNGKGSTCAMIDALARSCSIRSGLFTSPHLIDFRERIQVNGTMICEQTTAEYLSEIRELVAEWEQHPTFFEITLAVAMKHFCTQSCELMILETGMGGRLDATTAVPADLAVITPISMDHSQWLGETLAEVAAEKAGIIVPHKPVISSRQEPAAHAAIESRANEISAPLEFITEPLSGYEISLPGHHQLGNAALAVAAAKLAGLPLTAEIISTGLSSVTWPGRFEKLTKQNPPASIILDAAHNPHAAEALVATWEQQYPDQKATMIFGAVEGKNTEQVLAILTRIARHTHLTPLDSPRSLSAEQLSQAINPKTPHTLHQHLSEALDAAYQQQPDSPVLICGSIFLIGQAKAVLTSGTTRPSSQ